VGWDCGVFWLSLLFTVLGLISSSDLSHQLSTLSSDYDPVFPPSRRHGLAAAEMLFRLLVLVTGLVCCFVTPPPRDVQGEAVDAPRHLYQEPACNFGQRLVWVNHRLMYVYEPVDDWWFANYPSQWAIVTWLGHVVLLLVKAVVWAYVVSNGLDGDPVKFDTATSIVSGLLALPAMQAGQRVYPKTERHVQYKATAVSIMLTPALACYIAGVYYVWHLSLRPDGLGPDSSPVVTAANLIGVICYATFSAAWLLTWWYGKAAFIDDRDRQAWRIVAQICGSFCLLVPVFTLMGLFAALAHQWPSGDGDATCSAGSGGVIDHRYCDSVSSVRGAFVGASVFSAVLGACLSYVFQDRMC